MFSDTSYHYIYDLAKLDSEFQSPSGDSLFSDSTFYSETLRLMSWFQSPSGDSLFSDCTVRYEEWRIHMSRFNPLAGIRCFLTMYNKPGDRELVMSFNPLVGIRCFLTMS